MKRSINQVSRWSLLLLVGALGSASGCRTASGWNWRSPSSWFAGRQPDPAMIAGRTDASTTPTSPAEKYTPTALASTNQAGAAAPGSVANPAANSMANFPASSAGLAAQANGYQTGPYGMSPAAPPTTTATAANPSGTSGQVANSMASFPSPYGGNYTSPAATSTPNVALSSHNPLSAGYAGTAAPATAAATMPTYPSLPHGAAPSTVPGSLASVPYPSLGGTSVTAQPTPSTATQSTTAVPTASAYQAAPTGAYAPGTTGRTTGYNFGPDSTQTGTTSGQVPTLGLPPNTATGESLLLR